MPTANNTESNNEAGAPDSPEAIAENNANNNAESSNEAGQRGNGAAPLGNSAPTGQGGGHAPGNPPRSDAVPTVGEVLTAIQAMPEQIVRALKEATQAPKTPSTPSAGGSSQGPANGAQSGAQTRSQTSHAESNQSPGSKSFAQWWFGR